MMPSSQRRRGGMDMSVVVCVGCFLVACHWLIPQWGDGHCIHVHPMAFDLEAGF